MSKRTKWLIAAAFAGCIAFLLWWGGGTYARFKEQRLTARAQRLLENGDYKAALLTAQQILTSNPTNVAACLVMAELTERAKDSTSLTWRKRVAELSPTLENQLALAAAALLFERFPFALTRQTLEGIRSRREENVAYHIIAAHLALKLNQLPDAEIHYQKALLLEPDRESHQLNLAVLRLQSTNPVVVAAARGTLEQFIANPKLRSFALRSLVSESLDQKNFERALAFSEQLLPQRQASFGDRLQHLAILHDSHSREFDAFLSTVRSEAATNELQVYHLVGWMNSRGLGTEALAWVKSLAPTVRTNQPVPRAVVECLLVKKDWAELESYLDAQQWGGEDFVRLALLALALRNQDREESSKLRLEGAVRLASHNPVTLVILSQMLESWGWRTEAEETLELVVTRFPQDRRSSDAVCLSYYARGNTPALGRVLGNLLKLHPGDLEIANNYAMVCLLLGTNLTQAHELAKQAIAAKPRNPSYVSTHAFSLHTQGRQAEALALLRTLSPAELEEPGIALYYGLALAEVGEKEQAQRFLAFSEHAQLLPEERKLLEQAMNPQK